MQIDESIKIFKCLADKSRLSIINSLYQDDSYVEKISQVLSLAPSTVSFHLKKMEEVGIVTSSKEQYYTIYKLNKKMLNKSMLDFIEISDTKVKTEKEKYDENVLSIFFQNDKLVQIPVQRKKRRIILERIAKSFDINKKYTEKEVNLILADFNDDFCFLRRAMIEEKIMERDNQIYWLKNN